MNLIKNKLYQDNNASCFNNPGESVDTEYINAIELLAIGIGHVDADGKFIFANQHLCNLLGYTQDELLELTVKDISHPDDKSITSEDHAKLHAGKIESFKMEKRYVRKDKSTIWVGLTVAVNRNKVGMFLYDVSIVEDISARKEAEEKIQYLASYDDLTNLPNRMLFCQLTKQAIKYAKRYKRKFGVLFIDLDRFKHINDSLGHAAGDELLVEVAKRLDSCLRSSDVVSRLGGDEFAVLVHEVAEQNQVDAVAQKIITSVKQPFIIKGMECRVTASVGICMYPEGAEDEQELIQSSDKAMYLAKEEGKNNYKYYSDDLKARVSERLELESHLHNAMNLNEFEVYYQPRINVNSKEICGVEALLRWHSGALGEISPGTFIPLAEDMGIIIPLGKWVLKEACKQNRLWQNLGLPPLCVSVNISPRQFLDPELIPFISEILEKYNVNPDFLELEVTEGVVAQNPEQAVARLSDIKKMGVRIAIDDFGTGYSSLSQLKHFPIDTLKIDISFVRELPHDPENMAITEAIIVMSKLLNLTVVAEGVETIEQYNYLKQVDCDEIQGFYIAKPMSSDNFEIFLENQN